MSFDPNFNNRTLFRGDNLDFLRAMNSECVDLIATDPPFNKSRDFHATPNSLARGATFQDRWSWKEDIHQEWVDQIEDDWPDVMRAIQNARYSHSDGMGAYLCFMAVRLIAMRRILKNTGSIFLHCDPTASHYLKLLLDGIFGQGNFRNEIVWYYKNASRGKKLLAKAHDLIFWYSKSDVYTFNRDEILVSFESGMTEWRYNKGGQKGKKPPKGKTPDDVFVLPALNAMSSERMGWPTQKPLDLYSWLVKASSRKGDLVLDPFCGCATTLVAAERLGRRWAGVDIWNTAHEIVIDRLTHEQLVSPDGAQFGLLDKGALTFSEEPPTRTDDGETDAPFMVTVEGVQRGRAEMSLSKMREFLLQQRGAICQGCDRDFSFDSRNLQLDHILPRKDGGDNSLNNRALLCGPCNILKSDKLTLSGLRRENKKRGYMAGQMKLE